MIRDITQSIHVEAPVERVWAVLTTKGLVEEWLGCMQFEPAVGHLFFMQPDAARRVAGDTSGATYCELLRLNRPSEMAFSWFYPDMPKTEVAIRLAPDGDGTRVELVHSGWDQFDERQIVGIRDALEGGWKSFVLPGLKRLAESAAVEQ